jgi:hypothetical protein
MQPVCLITGASAGIGQALARVFAKHGHTLAITARRQSELEALADEIAGAGFTRPHVMAIDLGAANGPALLAESLQAAGLEPSIIVNSAGYGLLGEATETDAAPQLAMIDLNARTLTDLSLRWLEPITRHQGGILNVASVTGFIPGPGMAVYHATKAFVVSFTEALHEELKSAGVRICALCPGPVQSEFYQRAGIPHEYVPSMFERTTERVASEGYEGFMAGHRVVVPGRSNRVLTLLPRLLPRGLMLAIMARRRNRAKRRG